MEEATKYGATEVFMKDTGKTTRPTGAVDLYMLMVIFTMAIGKTIKPMATESTRTRTVPNMRVTGSMTNSTVKVWRSGRTAPSTKEPTNLVRRMDTVNSYGPTCLHTRATSLTTTSTALASTGGQMAECTKEIGYAIKCMVEETLAGLMAASTPETITTTRNKDMEYLLGQMVANIMELG